MTQELIKVDSVSKKFCRTLKRSMLYGTVDITKSMMGIPYKTDKLRKKEFWALKDISFSLCQGETLGIIGANGSGKSTLLRVLTGIFPPDEGRIEIQGRIGSLIAVGAGFHPHMSGRENVFLNGALLGMSRQEIKKHYQEIVDFSEIGEFIDAPVNTYSSGMRVRLGFAIAAHINPDILLVDEVLSVGDLNFKNKSLRKLAEVREKCATIFISHDMPQIRKISTKVIVMDKGQITFLGGVDEGISEFQYLQRKQEANTRKKEIAQMTSGKIQFSNEKVKIIEFGILDINKNKINEINIGDSFYCYMDIESKILIKQPHFGVGILDEASNRNVIYETNLYDNKQLSEIEAGKKYRLLCKINNCNIAPGYYALNLALMDGNSDETYCWKRGANKAVTDDRLYDGLIVKGMHLPDSYLITNTDWHLDSI